MNQLVVLSGKGGTGKTTVAAALAHLASRDRKVVLADADVDAANLELLLAPQLVEERDFIGGTVASIAAERCTACGICETACRFAAISAGGATYRVDELACEGCAACFYQCPANAIEMQPQLAGKLFRSDTRFGPLFHAHLFAGKENSGKLVTLVKQEARLLGLDTGADLLLVDGPPGIGCPVIAASAGADLALHVAEPTVSGVHDLQRIMATTDHFGVPSLVAVNKADLNAARCAEIEGFCRERGAEVVGRIPYDDIVTEAMVHAYPVTEYGSSAVADALADLWACLRKYLR